MSFQVNMSRKTLEFLAEERSEETQEIFTPNDFYGHASVLKRYCGLPDQYAIHGVLPHGPCITSKIWDIEKNHPLRARFLLSETQRAVYANQSDRDLYVIGSPLCYAERLLNDEAQSLRDQAKGTLVFPAHSTHHITAEFDHQSFIDRLKQFADPNQPITVCLYWRDIQLGRHLPYLDAGFQCTTAGHMFDKDFTYRMLKIILSHKSALTNRIGSSSLYAAAFGLPVRFTDLDVALTADHEQFRQEICPHDLPIVDSFVKAATDFNEKTLPVQQKLAKEALGYDHIQSPEALKDLFDNVEAIQQGNAQYTFPSLELNQPIPELLETVKERMIAFPRYHRGTLGFQGQALQFLDLESFHSQAHRIFVENTYQFNSTTETPVIVDCGTNLGLLPIYYAQAYPKARIVAFEADPIKARIAQENFQSANLGNARLINKAVWLDSGPVPFECHMNVDEKVVVQVPAVELSEFIGNQRIDLLRLNLAGAEFHVIQKSLTALQHVRHLIVEVRKLPGQPPHLADLLCAFRGLEFQCHLLEHWHQTPQLKEKIKNVTLFAWRQLPDSKTKDPKTPAHRLEVNPLDGLVRQVAPSPKPASRAHALQVV